GLACQELASALHAPGRAPRAAPGAHLSHHGGLPGVLVVPGPGTGQGTDLFRVRWAAPALRHPAPWRGPPEGPPSPAHPAPVWSPPGARSRGVPGSAVCIDGAEPAPGAGAVTRVGGALRPARTEPRQGRPSPPAAPGRAQGGGPRPG